MDDIHSSGGRSKARKTYSGRAKKRRESMKLTEESESDTNANEDEDAAAMPPPPSPQKETTSTKVKANSPRDANLAKTPAKKPTSKPASRRSSVVPPTDFKPSTPQMKPPSIMDKSPLSQRGQSPDGRDDISIAESSKTVRKSEEEREQFFKDQPECREVQPHRAFCTGCNEWVALNPRQTYAMRPWLLHRKECRKKAKQAPKPQNVAGEDKHAEERTQGEGSEGEGSPSVVRSSSDNVTRKSEAERQAYFERDPRAEEVRPYEVLCRNCKTWVKLGSKIRFALGNWKTHQQRCSGSLPSSRVATAERKLRLVNDPVAKSFSKKSVECGECGSVVELEGEDYDLTKWEEHKLTCQSAPSDIIATPALPVAGSTAIVDGSPHSSAKTETRPPPSVASTETAVSPETLGASRSAQKRARDDEEGEGEERPRTRARTESYRAVDWLLLPFKSFVSGFKAGLSSSPPPVPSTSSKDT